MISRKTFVIIIITTLLLAASFYFSKTSQRENHLSNVRTINEKQTSNWSLSVHLGGLDVYDYGFPLKSISKDCPGNCNSPSWVNWNINHPLNLLFDILFWLTVSYTLVKFCDKFTIKKVK